MSTSAEALEIQIWPIDRLIPYARNPRKNDAVVDRMCSSIPDVEQPFVVVSDEVCELLFGREYAGATLPCGLSRSVTVMLFSALIVKCFMVVVLLS